MLSTLVRNTQDDLNKLNDWPCPNNLSLSKQDYVLFIVCRFKLLTDLINIEINASVSIENLVPIVENIVKNLR